MMMHFSKLAALVGAFLLGSVPVQAVVTTFSGSGLLATQGGTLPSSGLTPLGSKFAFSFDFDFGNASPYEESVDESIYDLPVSNFSATLGAYSLSLSSDPLYIPFILITRDYSFVHPPLSEPSLVYSFYFSSDLIGSGSPATPFVLGNGSRIFLQISALFRADDQNSLGLDRVVDPAGAVERVFNYSARDVTTRRSGFLQGSYDGAFTQDSAVPEATVWTMMIIGFGAMGAVLRRRKEAVNFDMVPVL